MKVAVTGAGGFIGSHVLDVLERRDDVEIVAVSRQKPRRRPGVQTVALDLTDPQPGDYDRMGRPDVLIHGAWSGLPNYRSPHHLESELPAQYRFLQSLVEAGLPAVVVTGTCYEYGLAGGELDEEMAAAPVNAYAAAKAALYRQLEALRRDKPFELTWARLFYLWGPRQAPKSLFPQLRAAVDRGDPDFNMSPGDQVRDYLPVEAAAEVLVALAQLGKGAGLVNVCSGLPVTVRARVEQWIDDNGWDIALSLGRLPYAADEPHAFWGSTGKLRSLVDAAQLPCFSRAASGARSPSGPRHS